MKRLWEIDALRGIAVVMMIMFHVLWALNYFGFINFPQVNGAFWRGFAFATLAIFVFIVGVSLTLSYSRIRKTKENYVLRYLKRGLSIFGCGMIITLLTYIWYRDIFVYFGVLHLIGIGIILAIPFLKFKKINLAIGTILVILGIVLYQIILNTPMFMILGLKYYGLKTLDYTPLLPWFGVILLGIFFGNTFYPNGKRTFKVPEIPLKEFFALLGRHSLLIYFLHAVLLFGTIFIIQHI
jgi:uncharacterized membrane protein